MKKFLKKKAKGPKPKKKTPISLKRNSMLGYSNQPTVTGV